MSETIGSALCEAGSHMDCEGCKGLPLPPALRPSGARVGPDGSDRTDCSGTTWTPDRDTAA